MRERPGLYLAAHLALGTAMLLAWRLARGGDLRVALAAALVFRVVAAFGEPTLSDDVQRYVWDGRVQLHGEHPYRHAPDDPALEALRDESWAQINHPSLRTIYPPAAEAWFLLLAFVGAGPVGFKLAFGLIDFAVVLALAGLLRRQGLPPAAVLLYAWNPLAVVESSGSGHVEPLGILALLFAVNWILDGRPLRSAAALAVAIQVKLLPLLLIPSWMRDTRRAHVALLVALVLLIAAPYALTGPAVGSGTFDYAASWERNAVAFPLIEALYEAADLARPLTGAISALKSRIGETALDWDALYGLVWPATTARVSVALLALLWASWVARRGGLTFARRVYLALGGALLLMPTLHPWYVLWVLPFAAAYRSAFWLALGFTLPLAYWPGDGDVPSWIKAVEYGLPLAIAAVLAARSRFGRRSASIPA
ncbi:MAG: hypothetical protein GY716_05180 [bacterium]|nr:hypothetical protein [bacterium]